MLQHLFLFIVPYVLLNECISRNIYTLFLFKISYILFKKEYKVGDLVTFFLKDDKEKFIATEESELKKKLKALEKENAKLKAAKEESKDKED